MPGGGGAERHGAATLRREPGGLDVLTTGIGGRLVEAALAWAGERVSPALVVSTGAAGALEDGLAAGDVVVPDEVIGEGGRRHAVSPGAAAAYRDAARARGLAVSGGSLASVTSVLATAGAKRDARRMLAAAAVDMEAASVAGWAAARGLEFVAVKAILDSAATRLPVEVLAATDERGSPRLGKLLAALGRRPGLLVDLLRLGLATARCRRSLGAVHAAALERFRQPLREPDRSLQGP